MARSLVVSRNYRLSLTPLILQRSASRVRASRPFVLIADLPGSWSMRTYSPLIRNSGGGYHHGTTDEARPAFARRATASALPGSGGSGGAKPMADAVAAGRRPGSVRSCASCTRRGALTPSLGWAVEVER